MTALPTDDLGLLTRSLPIAHELRRRGHEVVFACPAAAPTRVVAQAGFANETPPHPLFALAGTSRPLRHLAACLAGGRPGRFGMTRRRFLAELVPAIPRQRAEPTADVHDSDHAAAIMGMLDPGFVAAAFTAYRRLIELVRPDVLIDFWNPLAVMAARSMAVPVATVVQADAHPASAGFRWWRPRPAGLPDPVPVVNAVGRDWGLPAVARVADYALGDVTLVVGTPTLDPLPEGAEATYVGALLWEQPGSVLPHTCVSERPLVWAYTGNPAYGRYSGTLDSAVVAEACLGALADLPVDLVVTTGHHRLPARMRGTLSPRVRALAWVPGLQMARRSNVLVHHGGYGSCQTGYWAGTPSVVMPTFSERESNARRVEQCGAGIRLHVSTDARGAKHVERQELTEAVLRVLAEPTFTEQAVKAGADLRMFGGAKAAADRIQGLM